MKSNPESQIILYQTPEGPELEVHFQEELVWTTQKKMAELFEVDVRTINEHLQNIFKTKELTKDSVIRKIRTTASDGKAYLTQFYSLDAILSVGYRVNSKRATQFRIWATTVLKNHLTQGYTINEKRLSEAQEKLTHIQNAITVFQNKSGSLLGSDQSKEILNLLANYAKALTLLENFDSRTLKQPKTKKSKFVLKYSDCLTIISTLKVELLKVEEASALFGQQRDGAFEGIIKTLYQTFDQKELYPSAESKAAHLLYFVIKDHPFLDGNKRIGSFLFVYFLEKSKMLYKSSGEQKINDNALTALALLIAESHPKEKETMIMLVLNLISE